MRGWSPANMQCSPKPIAEGRPSQRRTSELEPSAPTRWPNSTVIRPVSAPSSTARPASRLRARVPVSSRTPAALAWPAIHCPSRSRLIVATIGSDSVTTTRCLGVTMCCAGKARSIRDAGTWRMRPCQVMPPAQTLGPISNLRSATITRAPPCASTVAQASPPGPPPTTSTSALSRKIVISYRPLHTKG